jgi:N-acetyl-gamma-glutamyl-phosphate reductase
MKRIKASIIGITGYTGLELLRLLSLHPLADIVHLCARADHPHTIGDIFAHLSHLKHQISQAPLETVAADSDIVFVALPHRAAQDVVSQLHGRTRVIDLSADFRLDDAATYARYYETHKYPHLLREVAYGLPEVFGRNSIRSAQTIANPGCFALLAQTLLFPFRETIASADIFAVTGSSGAGKTPTDGTHHPIRAHNLRTYNINTHRHLPEIARGAGLDESRINFVPSSGPFVRGIFAQAFLTPLPDFVNAALPEPYADEPFIRIKHSVELVNVIGSNFVDISMQKGQDGRILVQGALDNLVKGAAGSAIQNMNIAFGIPETTGLITLLPVVP